MSLLMKLYIDLKNLVRGASCYVDQIVKGNLEALYKGSINLFLSLLFGGKSRKKIIRNKVWCRTLY